MVSGASNMLTSALGFSHGGVPGRVQAFASGGIVSQPTYFPMPDGAGLMGEAGAEAIMPLKRGSDGRLSVLSSAFLYTAAMETADFGGPQSGISFRVRQKGSKVALGIAAKAQVEV